MVNHNMWSLCLFFIVNIFTVAFSVCPAGWAQKDRTCYYIFGDKLNRSEASSLCGVHSAALVSFSDGSDWNYVSRLVSSIQLDAGAWTDLSFDNGKWKWSGSKTYTELNQWKVSKDDSSNGGTTPQPGQNYVPNPDAQHSWAKLYFDGTDTSLYVADGATLLHPFCERDIDARDLCDSNDEWAKLSHGCFKYFPSATWSDAVSTCSVWGGELITAASADDLEPVSLMTGPNTDVWIGIAYKSGAGYYLADGTTQMDYLPWLTPSSEYRNPNETCVAAKHTNSTAGYFMSSCNTELPFICKRPVGICPLGWYQDGIQCYKLHIRPEERMSWFMAVDYCKSLNGHMVEQLATKQAATLLYQALQENDVYFAWIGFSGLPQQYHYLSDMNNVAAVKTFVQYNTTMFKNGPIRCGITDFSPDRTVYPTVYCLTPRPFVCTISLTEPVVTPKQDTTSCKSGWVPFNHVCYEIVTQPMTYTDAVMNCESKRASIIIVNSTMEQSFFSTPTFTSMSLESFWIGFKLDGDDDTYRLEETNEEASFWNFDPYQTYHGHDALCCHATTGSTATFIGSWFFDDCQNLHPFICQMPGTAITPRQIVSTYNWSARCGVGWIFNNETNLCYHISPYIHLSWREARQTCFTMEGDLLSIYGQEEQDYVESILKSDQFQSLEEPLWMGAGDMYTNYGWGWSDGQPLKYIHWAEDQPLYNSDDGDNCGYIPVSKDFEWEARPCGEKLGYICKKEALPEKGSGAVKPPSTGACEPDAMISGEHSIQFASGFSASSYRDQQHRPERSRMVPDNNASWTPANDSTDEWLAVTFPSPVHITDAQLKGEDSTDHFVSKFELQYQYDDMSPWYWVTTGKEKRVFDGITMPDGSTSLYLFGEVQASSVKFWPLQWNRAISVQWELMGCLEDQCTPELSVSGPLIVGDKQFSASSESQGLEAWNARLNPVQANQTLSWWTPSSDDAHPWIQVDLGKLRIVRGIRLQGGMRSNHVTKFQLMFSQGDGSDPNSFITYMEPYGQPYTFNGVGHDNLPVDVWLKSSVKARVVRIKVLAWNNEADVMFDVYTCPVGCKAEPMVANLPTSSLTASDFEDGHEPSRSVLNTVQEGDLADAWKPHTFLEDSSYIQVDLGAIKQITAIATQGSESEEAWVSSYNLAFSTNGKAFWRYGSGIWKNVTYYTSEYSHMEDTDAVIYNGNFDGYTIVKNELLQPINARYVQLWPHEFHKAVVLRWEVYACSKHTASMPIGCYADDPADPDLPYEPYEDKYASIWPEACLSHCYQKGYHYAGIKNGQTCSCGNEYGMYGPASNCTIPCQQPYTNFTCGGPDQNIIFSTGLSAINMICPAGWTAYRDSCYAAIDVGTWLNSRSACQKMGGDLVDISDEGENDLVVSLLADNDLSTAWIGLNDIKTTFNFEWSTASDVTYTNWGYRQPIVNPGLEQHSVIISSDGTWSNVFSEDTNAFLCESPKKPSSEPVSEIVDEGCLMGWRGLGRKCYKFYRQKSSWQTAKSLCESNNSHLAHIDSRRDNTQLASALSVLKDAYWTDVRDGSSTGVYAHDSSTPDVKFANWGPQKPDAIGQCVSLSTAHHAGEWFNDDCTQQKPFICEQPRASIPPTRPPPTPQINAPCEDGWEIHGSLCYQFNIKAGSFMLSWHEASENCKEQGATLASFHSDVDFNAVATKIKNINKGSFWIGLSNLDAATGFEWSDGSVMNFIRWTKGEPRAYDPRAVCGELLVDSSAMGLQWCSQLRNWVCSIKPGTPVQVIANKTFPQPDPDGCQPLSNQWQKYGNYCYYITNGESGVEGDKTWREARQFCGMQGADLASINSEDENRFLQGMLTSNLLLPVDGVWIGLNELDRDRGYSWSDGSPVGLWSLNWNVNEPNDYDGLEACVEFLARNGKWNDKHCGLRAGFVCKRPAPGVNITKPEPVERPDGNCPTDFSMFGHKCFRIMGEVGMHVRLSWQDARTSCKNMLLKDYPGYNVDLASITSVEENAFLVTLMNKHRESVWIGLRRQGGQFLWSDNEDLTFESWNKDEPNMGPGNDSCVYMYGPAVYAGTWNDVSCEEKAAYVCQSFVDPSFPPVFAPPSPQCNSEEGFEQYGTSCVKVYNESQIWEAAQAHCGRFAANLAYIEDSYVWWKYFLMTRGFDEGVWTGFNDRRMTGHYEWASYVTVTFTRWAHHQPLDQDGWGCVFMDPSGLFNNGPCKDSRPFICRNDFVPPSEVPELIKYRCPDDRFTQMLHLCVLMVTNQTATFDRAVKYCQERGATLASQHNDGDYFEVPAGKSLWIGLVESIDEGFSWMDNTVVEYTHWATGQPSWSGEGEAERACVVLHDDQTWSNVDCEDSYGFMCTQVATYESDLLTLPPAEDATTKGTELTPTPYPQESPSPPATRTSPKSTSATTPNTITTPRSSSRTQPSHPVDQHTTTRPTGKVYTITPVPHTAHPTLRTPSTRASMAVTNSDSGGIGGGAIAGIIIAVLIIVAIVIAGVFILRRRGLLRSSFLRREAKQAKNFENSLYTETHNEQPTKTEDGEVIAIVPLGAQQWDYGVSYSTGAPPLEDKTVDDNSEA